MNLAASLRPVDLPRSGRNIVPRSPRHLTPALVAAAALLLAGCGSGAVAETGGAAAHAGGEHPTTAAAGALPGEHAHGVSRNPGDGKVYLATHHGLYRYDKGTPVLVGPMVDWMGFSVAGPGRFYASGHPAEGVDMPAPAGLMETKDAGKTWVVRSRGGESDFHALTSSSKGVVGYDGALRSTVDGTTWTESVISSEPRALAASPDGSKVLATTTAGLLVSKDQGATWAPLPSAPGLLLVAWADNKTAAGVMRTGALAVTTDAGATWKISTAKVTSAQTMSASRVGKTLEILVVTDTDIQRTLDSGATLTPLGDS
jgi:photosystem II stability/assembly factor-like uncharacterized protein